MTTPTGQIGLSDVNVELGKSSTALITKNDTDVRTLAGRTTPQSQISMDDLRGKTWDATKPTVSITRSGSGTVIQGQTLTITFTVSETVTGFTSTDVSVTNGTISSFSGSGTSYSAIFTPTNGISGNATISISENSFVDANNNGNLSASLTIAVDTIKPTISITRSGSGTIGSGQTTTITFSISESTSNFISSDVSVSGGSISGFNGSGTSYTATFTPNSSFTGTATITVNADTFTDSAGNGNIVGSLSISVDTQVPSVTITRSGVGTLISGQTDTISFTLSENSTDFTSADVTTTNGTLSGFSGSGSFYTATFTPQANFSGTGTISVAAGSFTDSIGNGNIAGSLNISIETGAVSMSINTSASQPITGSVTINFISNKFTTNFTSTDISVSPGTFSNFSGSGVSYSILYNPPSNSSGTATISVAAGSYTDGAGNSNSAASLNITYNTVPVDNVRPSISITRSEVDTNYGSQEVIAFTTSESTSNFTLGDIDISGGTLSGFSGSGTSYTATYTPPSNTSGTTTISVPQNVFTDAAGNGNFASNTLTFSYNTITAPVDTTSPTVTITRSGSGSSTGAETIGFTISEPTTNFTSGDVTITNGTLTNFSGSSTLYSATYTPPSNSSGTTTISVSSGVFTDAAGNGNIANNLQISYNTVTGGGGVTIVSTPSYNNTGRTSTDYTTGYGQVTLNYFSNGTYEFYDNGGEGGFQIDSGNWATPTTGGVGSNYWIRFTRTSQNVGQYGYAVPTTGWINLGSMQQIYVNMSNPDTTVRTASATYTVEISSNSSGTNVLSSGTITLYAVARTENFN